MCTTSSGMGGPAGMGVGEVRGGWNGLLGGWSGRSGERGDLFLETMYTILNNIPQSMVTKCFVQLQECAAQHELFVKG